MSVTVYDSWSVDTAGGALRPVANRRILLGGVPDDTNTTLQSKGAATKLAAKFTDFTGDFIASFGGDNDNAASFTDGTHTVGISTDTASLIASDGTHQAVLCDGTYAANVTGKFAIQIIEDTPGDLTTPPTILQTVSHNDAYEFDFLVGVCALQMTLPVDGSYLNIAATDNNVSVLKSLRFQGSNVQFQAVDTFIAFLPATAVLVATTTDDSSGSVLQVAGSQTITEKLLIGKTSDSSDASLQIENGGIALSGTGFISVNGGAFSVDPSGNVVSSGLCELSQVQTAGSNQAVYSDNLGILQGSSTTDTELGYVHGVTSAIQTQLDSKAPSFTSADATAQAATNNSVATLTTPNDGNSHTYNVGAYLTVTAVTLATVTVSVAWTEDVGGGTARTANFFGEGLTTAAISTVGAFPFPPMTIRAKANTAITIKSTAVITTSVAYNVGGWMQKVN